VNNSKKILIVEDDPVHARMTRLLVERYGYKPTVVGSLTAASNLQDRDWELVFLDLLLPETTHATLDQSVIRIRALLPNTPIIVLSCYLPELNVFNLIKLGADLCLYKPLNPETLLSVIAKAKAINRGDSKPCLAAINRTGLDFSHADKRSPLSLLLDQAVLECAIALG